MHRAAAPGHLRSISRSGMAVSVVRRVFVLALRQVGVAFGCILFVFEAPLEKGTNRLARKVEAGLLQTGNDFSQIDQAARRSSVQNAQGSSYG
jgi:hypothetical protein